MLYRRSIHDEIGWYDESLDAVEDWDLYLRILRAGEIGFLPGEALAFWTQRPDATGLDANSMFALTEAHAADDARVRDRALAEWVGREGRASRCTWRPCRRSSRRTSTCASKRPRGGCVRISERTCATRSTPINRSGRACGVFDDGSAVGNELMSRGVGGCMFGMPHA